MKATGIVRRIDDLGRVVIPKEIRRTMRIREGDPLEIYTDKEGEVIFKKYSLMGNQSEFTLQVCEVLNKITGICTAVSDGDSIIASAGTAKRELDGKQISENMDGLITSRAMYQHKNGDAEITVCDGECGHKVLASIPIICGGDVLGNVVFSSSEASTPVAEGDCRLAQAMAMFLSRHMEA